jgi:hypothetical protein
MASITLTVVGTTVGTVTATNTMSQADGDRFLAYLAYAYGTNDDGSQRTPQGTIEAAWAAIRSGMMANVVNYEKQIAMEAAAAGIADIVVN